MSYSEREQQLLRKQNNPLGYKDNEVVEKIIVDKGTNNYDIQHILEDKDEMKSYYIVVWNEGNSMKRYKKVDRDYFKKVHPGDTWDEKNDDTSTDYYEWQNGGPIFQNDDVSQVDYEKGVRNLNMSKENKFILIGLISTVLLGIILVFPLIDTLKKNAAIKERIEYLEKRQTKPSYKDGEVIEIADLNLVGDYKVVYWDDFEDAKVYESAFQHTLPKVGEIYK